ncbi:ABC transporter substrate-binding protein [Celerinatantimonas sp. MCCC 1A17872]|uniref:ABC transporter substrate-binding protein n=1 Tax=Celerinatantimonas sp. MCCC 1A17872 TaxID=3177514 RepID=UPI0038CA357E
MTDAATVIPETEMGTPIFKPDALNLVASVPCPIKVKFKMVLEAFIDQYNASHDTPIYCPSIMDGIPHGLEETLRSVDDPQYLPDLWLSTSMRTALTQPFRKNFIDSGVLQGINSDLSEFPQPFKDAGEKYNLGFFAFGNWSLLCDLSVKDAAPYPRTWDDLLQEQYHGQIAIHGCHGEVGAMTLLQVLLEKYSDEGIRKLAHNIGGVRHFSKLIKAVDSNDKERVAYNILPNAAINQLPSRKRAAIVELEDGPLLTPMTLFAKKSKLAELQPIIEFLKGPKAAQVFHVGGFIEPAMMDWAEPFTFPSWESLLNNDHAKMTEHLNNTFIDALAPGLMTV